MNITCGDVMLEGKLALCPHDSIYYAFQIIKEHRIRYLPVVDENDIYLGVFTSATLIRLLLPRSMSIDIGGLDTERTIQNLNFFTITQDDFHQQLQEIKDETVINYLSDKKNIPIAYPDTAIMEGILLLHKYKRHVVIIDKDTQKFKGVLTINSVLETIFN